MLIALSCLVAEGARAAEPAPSKVVIMAEAHTEAVSQRLRQEIEALGFEVEIQPESAPLRSLEAVAEEARAMASIRVKSLQAGGVEMTVLDRVTGKTVHRELARVSESDAADGELVATRTVELFRASLMELSAAHPARGNVPASPPVRALVQRDQPQSHRPSSTASLAVGPALALMPGWSPSARLWLTASWLSRAGLGVNAAVLTALTAAHLASAEGAVDLTSVQYRLGATWAVCPEPRTWCARFGAGWSLTTLRLRGTASAPYVAAQADRISLAPWLSASARLRLAEHVSLLGELSGALALPSETVRFAGREVAGIAEPAVFVALGPELSWP